MNRLSGNMWTARNGSTRCAVSRIKCRPVNRGYRRLTSPTLDRCCESDRFRMRRDSGTICFLIEVGSCRGDRCSKRGVDEIW